MTRPRLVAGALLATIFGFASRAGANGDAALLLIPAALPSEFGVDVPIDEEARAAGYVGWAFQHGLYEPFWGAGMRHRGTVSAGLLINGGGASWRGRLGYRYAYRDVFGGLGIAFEGRGFAASPEVGLKFLHADSDLKPDDLDISLHAIVRAQVGPYGVESTTLLLGWNLF